MRAVEAEPLLLSPQLTKRQTALALYPDLRPAFAMISTATCLGDAIVFVLELPFQVISRDI